MHRTTTAPAPLNLITTWLMWLIEVCKVNILNFHLLSHFIIKTRSFLSGTNSEKETSQFDADDAFTAR